MKESSIWSNSCYSSQPIKRSKDQKAVALSELQLVLQNAYWGTGTASFFLQATLHIFGPFGTELPCRQVYSGRFYSRHVYSGKLTGIQWTVDRSTVDRSTAAPDKVGILAQNFPPKFGLPDLWASVPSWLHAKCFLSHQVYSQSKEIITDCSTCRFQAHFADLICILRE